MILKKSPGGSIFPYYFKNGELFGAHYESFAREEHELLERIKAEEEFVIQQHYPLPYWVNFYGTELTDKVLSEFAQSIVRLQEYIPKLAIVGCSFIDKWRFQQGVKRLELKVPVHFYKDPEAAKAWLVSENY